ncbi:MAG TPA: hypothetical protein PLK94_14455 [Alphaproteobacteria bacterium]|nr:hypothetical protein [Alphaproteobacteria bacterium]
MPSFNKFYEALVDAGIDWAADTIKPCAIDEHLDAESDTGH